MKTKKGCVIMFNSKKRKAMKQETLQLKMLEASVSQQIEELKEIETSIQEQMDELNKTIEVAQEYLALCGYSEKDIERMKIRNKLKAIK